MALVHINAISIFKCNHRYRSHVLRYIVEKAIDSEFCLHLSKFYIFCVHVMYAPCSKLPFSMKHVKWQLSTMAPGNPGQTTPVQIMCVFCVMFYTNHL